MERRGSLGWDRTLKGLKRGRIRAQVAGHRSGWDRTLKGLKQRYGVSNVTAVPPGLGSYLEGIETCVIRGLGRVSRSVLGSYLEGIETRFSPVCYTSLKGWDRTLKGLKLLHLSLDAATGEVGIVP